MIVSHNWLNDYVQLNMPLEELYQRLTMSGLNHEGSEVVGSDHAIDLEVTSNRADCLGHLGVAREIATLFDLPLKIPSVEVATSNPAISDCFGVSIECPELCYRFTARLVRGVKVGPSPDWLVDRLCAIGIATVNNVVDVSNYVMFECGQPLHTFDFHKLRGAEIIVREPQSGEVLEAINHHTYNLEPGMCVIADGRQAVGLGGVMGGAETEVSGETRDVLVEAAYFNPVAIRNTARRLNLFSPASHRFERAIDSHQIDWASQRCCQLLSQVAGGEIAAGCTDIGQQPVPREPINFRYQEIDRLLGISIPKDTVQNILMKLGFELPSVADESIVAVPPSWRSDVSREADLVEEVGRIYGYDHVPDDGLVPLAATVRPAVDRVGDKIRYTMIGAGFDEAMTASMIPEKWSEAFSPWTDSPPIQSAQPMLGVLEKASQNVGPVNLLRRSIVPSLLEALRINEYKVNKDVNLFEMARVYLPNPNGLPDEPVKLALVTQRTYQELKGVVEALVAALNPQTHVGVKPCDFALLDLSRSCELSIAGECLGFMGEVSDEAKAVFGLRESATAAELDLDCLLQNAVLIPKHQEVSPYPPVSRDFNFVLDETVRWMQLQSSVRDAAGDLLESVTYKETFRDPDRDGPDKKRVLLSVVLRSPNQTLTGQQAEEVCDNIVVNCKKQLSATLLG